MTDPARPAGAQEPHPGELAYERLSWWKKLWLAAGGGPAYEHFYLAAERNALKAENYRLRAELAAERGRREAVVQAAQEFVEAERRLSEVVGEDSDVPEVQDAVEIRLAARRKLHDAVGALDAEPTPAETEGCHGRRLPSPD